MVTLYLTIIGACLAVVLLLEEVFKDTSSAAATLPLRRWLTNLVLAALAIGSTMVVAPLYWQAAAWLGLSPGHSGLLPRWQVPIWLQWVITFLVMDGLHYTMHRLHHAVPLLWKWHAIHHGDEEVDATTTHRHHPFENWLNALAAVPVLLLLTPPFWAVFAYSVTHVAVSTLAHGRLHLPAGVDRVLRKLLVTPSFHRIHHSATLPETDRNFALVFPLFDHLFRTASAADQARSKTITVGLDHWPIGERAKHSAWALLASPFQWEKPQQ